MFGFIMVNICGLWGCIKFFFGFIFKLRKLVIYLSDNYN